MPDVTKVSFNFFVNKNVKLFLINTALFKNNVYKRKQRAINIYDIDLIIIIYLIEL